MTTSLSPEEIRRALWENQSAPNGPLRNARGEELAAAAESTGDRDLLRAALFGLIQAYEYSTERGKMLVPFARLLQEWDADPSAFDGADTHTFHWMFKWVSSGMLSLPEIPLATMEQWLAEMERRYRTAGFTERAVRQAEFDLAEQTGDTGRTARAFEAWTAAERDRMANCHACELNDQGTYWMSQGQDDKALGIWEPVLADRSHCAEEPHRVLAKSLLPLVRTGRLEEARANHLRGYRMARGNESLLPSIGRHIEFCALTGNEGRGLELLAEHAQHLSSDGNAYSRLELFTGALTLLRRLLALGLDTRPAVPMAEQRRTVRELHDLLHAEAASIAARFDARNGSDVVSGLLKSRLECEPLLGALPLGVRAATLTTAGGAAPTSAAAPGATGVGSAGAGSRTAAGTGPGAGAVRTVPELVAEAREMRGQGHPGTSGVWDLIASRLARDGMTADPLLTAELLERGAVRAGSAGNAGTGRAGGTSDAGSTGSTGEKTVRELFEEVVVAYRAVGELSRAALNELRVAYVAARAGASPGEIRALLATAEASARALPLTDPTRTRRIATIALNTIRLGPTLRHQHEEHEEHGDADHGSGGQNTAAHDHARTDAELAAFVAEFSTAPTDEGGAPRDPGDPANLADLLSEAEALRAEHAWREGATDRADALFVSAARRAVDGGYPWEAAEPLAQRARLLLMLGRPQEAESPARAALEHGAELVEANELGHLRLTLADALYQQDGKEAEAAEYALEAAHWLDAAGQSAGAGAYARLLLAQSYGETGRHAEAAEVLESALPDLLEHGQGQTVRAREALGRNLRALGDQRAAAEQYLLAAEMVGGWEDDRPQAQLATLAAECLSEAGLREEAVAAYHRAIELWRSLGEPVAAARALRSLAWLEAGEGDRESAEELMAQALATVDGESEGHRLERARTWSQTGELLLNGLYEDEDEDEDEASEDGQDAAAGRDAGKQPDQAERTGQVEQPEQAKHTDALRVREEALRLLELAESAFAALGAGVVDERVRCAVRMAWTEQEMDRADDGAARLRTLIDEVTALDTDDARALLPRLEHTLKQLTHQG
ncbi:tetratricopeptide repeat protein [Streptomyces sp. NBC_00872]|uniref:tetratricopeptide repeat protein n=1 Tax=Streptomyces sp. NBC_00872 TaxID=2903686 RepID=UPI003865A61C|nr:tetratricopeptide repeat protein [Streptomyces sp. NBC_00872]